MDISSIKVPAHIENPGAYRRAVAAQIERRARAARQKKAAMKLVEWMAADQSRIPLIERLTKEQCKNDFFASMSHALTEWGGLTEKQEAAVRASFARMDERAAARLLEAGTPSTSKHMGMVGKRAQFGLTLKEQYHVRSYDFWVNKFEDSDGNRFDYVGTKFEADIDAPLTIRATVKSHEERDGVKLTRINRLKIEDPETTPEHFLSTRFSTGSAKAIKL